MLDPGDPDRGGEAAALSARAGFEPVGPGEIDLATQVMLASQATRVACVGSAALFTLFCQPDVDVALVDATPCERDDAIALARCVGRRAPGTPRRSKFRQWLAAS